MHQVGLDRVFHQHGQRAGYTEIFRRNSFTLFAGSNDHATQAVTHVFQAGCQGKDRHDLRGDGNIVTRAMFKTGFILAESHLDFAQETVVHIDDAPPLHAIRVNIEAGKARALLGSQFIGIGPVDAQVLESA